MTDYTNRYGRPIGFGGAARDYASSKDPHHPDFGLIEKKKPSSDLDFVPGFEDGNALDPKKDKEKKRDLFALSKELEHARAEKKKRLDENEKSHRNYIFGGRLFGLDSAAENLEHYLDGQGKDKILTRKDVEKRPFLKEAAEENNKRFQTQTFNQNSDHTQKLLNLKDGQETEVNDYWVKKISYLDHISDINLDEILATGKSHVHSGTKLKAKRVGNKITVEGIVNHNWNDLYDFDKEQYSDTYELQEKGRADNYNINANWKHKIKMNFEIKNGKLIYKTLQTTDIEE